MRTFKEVEYACKCGAKQTIRYFPDDSILPATACVACKTGFSNEMSYSQMAMRGVGMVAGKPEVVNG